MRWDNLEKFSLNKGLTKIRPGQMHEDDVILVCRLLITS